MGKILGLDIKYLDNQKCKLSWEGADALQACNGALIEWRKSYKTPTGKPKKLSAKQIVVEFQHYCVPCFISTAISELLFMNTITPEMSSKYDNQLADQVEELCTCDKKQAAYNDDEVQFLERILKAIIILAKTSNFMEKKNEEDELLNTIPLESKTDCGCDNCLTV